jgi:hypothetical protein
MIVHTMATYSVKSDGCVITGRVPVCKLHKDSFDINIELNKTGQVLKIAPELNSCSLCINKIFPTLQFKDVINALNIWYSEYKDGIQSAEQFVRMTLGE